MVQPNEKAFITMDEYEKNLIEVIENGDMVLQKPSQERLDMLQDSAKKTLKLQEAKKQISIKLKAKDISIPYQNIIQALVHNYATGKIKLEI